MSIIVRWSFPHDEHICNFQRENSSLNISAFDWRPVKGQIFRVEIDDGLQSMYCSIYNYLKRGPSFPETW